jgi:hypothetical protein
MCKVNVHDLCFHVFCKSYISKFYDEAVLLTERVRIFFTETLVNKSVCCSEVI